MDDLARGYPARQEANRLRNENEDLRDGAEHDHGLVRELEKKVEHYMKVKEEWMDKAVELRKQLDAAQDVNAKLREQNEALAKRIAHLDGLLESVRRKHGFDTGETDDRS